MAEVLGVVASVVGIAGVGIKLSKTLYVSAEKHIHASHNINRVAANVTLFSSMLKQFAAVLQDAKSLYSQEALDTTKQIVDECSGVFNEITSLIVMGNGQDDGKGFASVPNDKKPRLKMVHKIKWYFEQPRVDLMLQQLEYLKTTLSVLLQTLHLAAVLKQTKEKEQVTERETQQIIEERVHIETLIMARQMTVIILQQLAKAEEESQAQAQTQAQQRTPALNLGGMERVDSRAPKLLMQEPANAMSLVRVGGGNLDFLDMAPAQPVEMLFPATKPHSNSPIVDQLLGRMTRLNEVEVHINEVRDEGFRLGEEATVAMQGDERNRPLDSSANTVPDRSGWSTRPNQAKPLVSDEKAGLGIATPPASTTLPPPPKSTNGFARAGSSIPPPPQGPAPKSSMKTTPKTESPASASSERSLPPTQLSTPPPANMSKGAILPIRSPEPIQIPMAGPAFTMSPQVASPRTAPGLDQYTPSNPYVPPLPISTKPTFGSRNSSPGAATPTSEDEDDDEANRIGLGIPWRIRIGPNKYFDFLDAKLVGPRTPYLPSEPMSWVYSHDYAQTEISSSWVSAEAIAERAYKCTQAPVGDDVGGDAKQAKFNEGDEVKWIVASPLKFSEIEALVDRTVEIYRQRNAVPSFPPQRSETEPRSRSAAPPTPQSPPLLPPPQIQPYGPPRPPPPQAAPALSPLSPVGYPPHPQPNRSVSFSGADTRSIGPARPDLDRTTTERGVHWAPTPVPSVAQPYYSPVAGNLGAPPYNSSMAAPRNLRDPQWPEAARESRGFDAGGGGERPYRTERDFERERPPSRGKAKEARRASERDRKKKAAGSMAGTLAKIGGLAALLEGLDTI